MAKIKKTYTKQEILDVTPEQLNKLTRQELRYLVSSANRMISSQRSRLEKLKSEGLNVPALDKVTEGVTPFTVDGELKNINQLRAELTKAQNIMGLKTYSTQGAKSYTKATTKAVTRAFGREVTKSEMTKFFDAYNKFKELSVDFKQYIDSDQIMKLITTMLHKSPDEIAIDLDELVSQAYEKEQKRKLAEQEQIMEGFRNGKTFTGGSNI